MNKRNTCDTDPISLYFAYKRKKYLSETGAPYFLFYRYYLDSTVSLSTIEYGSIPYLVPVPHCGTGKKYQCSPVFKYFSLDSHCGEASLGPVHTEEVRAEGGRPRQGTATLHVTNIQSPDMSPLSSQCSFITRTGTEAKMTPIFLGSQRLIPGLYPLCFLLYFKLSL